MKTLDIPKEHYIGSYFIDEKRPKVDFGKDEINDYELSMKSGGAFGNKKY